MKNYWELLHTVDRWEGEGEGGGGNVACKVGMGREGEDGV